MKLPVHPLAPRPLHSIWTIPQTSSRIRLTLRIIGA